MKISSKQRLLLILVLEAISRNATLAFLSDTHSRVHATPLQRSERKSSAALSLASIHSSPLRSTHTQLNLDLAFLDPLSSLHDSASALLPSIVQQVSQTLSFQPSMALTLAQHVQTVGEASFAGMLAIAGIQGALVMQQYKNNPNGGLIVPPGLTVGVEDATKDSFEITTGAEPTMTCTTTTSMFGRGKTLTDAQIHSLVCDAEDSELSCAMKKQWYHMTMQILAIALVPLAAVAGPSWGLAAWMMQYSHIMHLAVMFGLTHFYDFFRKLPNMETLSCRSAAITQTNVGKTQQVKEAIFTGDHPRVIVLGDSMCVGIGTW
jgi:hypothetical protein